MTDVAPLSNTEKISPLRLDSKKFAGRELPDIPVAVSRQRGNPRRVLSGITRQSASELFRGDIAVIVFESEPGKVERIDTL